MNSSEWDKMSKEHFGITHVKFSTIKHLSSVEKLHRSAVLSVPGGLRQLPVDFFIHINIESSLDKWQSHLEGFHPQLWAVVSNELQPLNPHQTAVTGCILLQVLQTELRLRRQRWQHQIKTLQHDPHRIPCSLGSYTETQRQKKSGNVIPFLLSSSVSQL